MSDKDDKKHITKISATESHQADEPKSEQPAPAVEKSEPKAAKSTDTKTAEAKSSEAKVATKEKTSAKPASKDAKPTESKPAKKIAVKDLDQPKKPTTDDKGRRALSQYFIIFRPFVAFQRYLHDSWIEICQVRWPGRKMTWKLTLAVLIYVAIFMVFIVVLDMIFTFLFNKLLGQ